MKAITVGDSDARLTRPQEPPTIAVSDVGRVFSCILTGSHTTARNGGLRLRCILRLSRVGGGTLIYILPHLQRDDLPVQTVDKLTDDCFRRLILLREKDFQCFELFVIKRDLNGYLFYYACPPIVGASVFSDGSLNHLDHCFSLQYPASAKEKSRRRCAGHPDTSICVPYTPS